MFDSLRINFSLLLRVNKQFLLLFFVKREKEKDREKERERKKERERERKRDKKYGVDKKCFFFLFLF